MQLESERGGLDPSLSILVFKRKEEINGWDFFQNSNKPIRSFTVEENHIGPSVSEI